MPKKQTNKWTARLASKCWQLWSCWNFTIELYLWLSWALTMICTQNALYILISYKKYETKCTLFKFVILCVSCELYCELFVYCECFTIKIRVTADKPFHLPEFFHQTKYSRSRIQWSPRALHSCFVICGLCYDWGSWYNEFTLCFFFISGVPVITKLYNFDSLCPKFSTTRCQSIALPL